MSPLVTPADLATWLGQQTPDRYAQTVCDAVNAVLATYPHLADPDPRRLPAYRMGAAMMAARLHRRRNSPGGIESMDGGVMYVARTDPDAARLLGIDGSYIPVVG